MRSFAAFAMLAPFLLSQLAWLPLGMIGGASRQVAVWSKCGQRLCDCTPDPACALCPEGTALACADATPVASQAPRKTDNSESRELQQKIALAISALVAIAHDDTACTIARPLAIVGPRVWAVDAMPASRTLTPAPPPPWA